MASANPLVSVISVFYNRGAEVERSVGSLLAQTYEPLEIIIVDDGSTDDTADRLSAINDPRLKIVLQKNQGFSRTIDETAKAAKGAFVAIHGAGDISLPTRLAAQAKVLRENPEVGVVGCYIANESGRQIALRSQTTPEQPLSYIKLLGIYPISHGEAMFRKSVFDEVGGYRPFFTYAQDHDLWLRMDRLCKFWTVAEVLYQRRRFDNAVSADPIKMMFQGYYADFAQQCAKSWQAGKGDFLDRYGHSGIFMRSGSKSVAKRMNLFIAAQLAEGDEDKARAIIASNRAQSHSLQTQFLGFLGDMSTKQPRLWRAVGKPMLKWAWIKRSERKSAKEAAGAPNLAISEETSAATRPN